MTPDPDEALRRALFEMRSVLGTDGEPAALYRFFPPERLTVDRAGYMQTLKADVPARLVSLANEEPEGVMRYEALASVAVRRAEVRPLMEWMDERGFLAISVVRDADGPMGAIVVPRGARTAPSLLAEVRALRELSDRLGAVLGVASMLARSRERELLAQSGIAQIESERQKVATELERIQGTFTAIAKVLERPARVALYSPASRAAVQRLETLAQTNSPVTLLSAPGIDVIAWAALVHLASPRKTGVMVVVDGGSAVEHDVGKWHDRATSPMTAAAGGTLVLVDAHLLPALVQMRIASSARDDCSLVAVLPKTVDSLAANGKLVETLADRLGDRAVALPEISARAEDLSLLILDKLTRMGPRIYGSPLGIEPHAMAALVEYNFPGNDVELEALLLRAVLAAPPGAKVVTLRDLEAAGFSPPPGSTRRVRRTVPPADGRRKRGGKTS
jgi:transcriptional regulator of acetoin/glycerol metabolism